MCSDSETIRPKCVQDLFFPGSKDKSSGPYSSAGLGLGITERVDVSGLLLKSPGHCREHAKEDLGRLSTMQMGVCAPLFVVLYMV